MRIQHNIMAMSAYRNYTNNVSAMKKNLEKLSSGYKINRAGDDAAGLAISEKMRAQITGLETAQKNAKDGISLVQTAEGALTEVHDMLNRMVELATQSANGTYDNTTDRAQMQKEVDQLLKEINRIADSSNFNGINLLDGTLGLNKDAFSFSEAAAVSASDGTIDISKLLSAENAGATITHLEGASATAAPAKFTVDLTGLNIDHNGQHTTNDAAEKTTLTIGFAGKTIDVDLKAIDAGAVKDYAAADVVDALAAALKADSTLGAKKTGDTTATAVNINGYVFDITDNGDSISFELVGTTTDPTDATAYKSLTDKPLTADDAKAINAAIGSAVTVTAKTTAAGDGTTTITQGKFHNTTNVEQAVAKVDATLAGIDLKITADMVKDGTKITIDGTEYTIHSDPNDTTASYTGNDIDIRKGVDDTDRIHKLVDALSGKTTTTKDGRTFKIESKGNDTIHIDQTAASTAGKEIDTYDKLTGLISVKGAATTAKNVGTNIKITDAEVKEGNTLTIDGKKYVFSDEKTGTDGDTTYVAIKGGAGQNLANAITGSGSEYDAATNTVTVRAANATDKAPMVLGKGLTLQIGDTSDTFNQLNVAVQDMHAASLGIKDLKINTEEAAQAAIKNIKDAINTVSDVRGTLGATQNRLDHTINNLSVMTENIQDAESTIRDVDVAEEMMAYTKNNILIQSAQAMLAQANQVPQGVLQLLQ